MNNENNNKTTTSTTLLKTIITSGFLLSTSTILPQIFAQEPEVFIAPGASDPNNNEGAYVPSELIVPVGTIVTWLNTDL